MANTKKSKDVEVSIKKTSAPEVVSLEDKRPHSYVNPRFDVAFRKLFSADAPEITISLLNSILCFSDKDKIISVEFQDSVRPPNSAGFRGTVQDLICIDQKKRQYLVELQVADQRYFFRRMLYYFSRMYGSQLVAGDSFSDLKPAYSVGILNFDLFNYTERFHTVHKICDIHEKKTVETIKEVEFHMIELSKFYKTADECKTALEQWLYFFKHSERVKSVPAAINDPVVKLAFDKIDEFNWSAQERTENEASIKAWRDNFESLATAHEKGLAKGKDIGKAEAMREMAQGMIKANILVTTISTVSGLSIEEIEELKAKK